MPNIHQISQNLNPKNNPFRTSILWLAAALTLLLPSIASAQFGGGTTSEAPKPIVEWEKRQNADERLTAFGDDLMGDGIDPHTGSITFEHADVSLPGNSALDVSLKRRRSQGYLYHEDVDAEFGDWEYLVPRIKVISAVPWTGARCTSSYNTLFPSITKTANVNNGGGVSSITTAQDYSQGVTMDVPGFGSQQVLEGGGGPQFPAAATHATKDKWYLTCGSASDGGQGFIAKAPNGNTYRFDKFISHKAKSLGYVGASPQLRYAYILAATEVTDVNGNWVRYVYDGAGRLTKIHSNDGRQITLTYSGSSKLVSTVNANGRQWQYSYRQSNFHIPFWEAWNYPQLDSQVLSGVTLPDGQSWTLNMDWMTAEPSPAIDCQKKLVTISMTHPYGTAGTFKIKDMPHRFGYYHNSYTTTNCPDIEPGGSSGSGSVYFQTVQTNSMSVIEKKLQAASQPTATWSYTYEQDAGPSASSGSDRTNWTKVQGPGVHLTYYHQWIREALGGKLLKRETRASAGGAVLETENYTYVHDAGAGSTFIYSSTGNHTVLASDTVTQRGSDTYTTNRAYNLSAASNTYSYGKPLSTSVSSNIATTPRTTVTTYEHNASKWILGLVKTVATNGRPEAASDYDNDGQKTSETRYGYTYATYSYNSDGTIAWARDALDHTTYASQWKPGTPQKITRADGSFVYQYVDDNGWLTSSIDAMNNTTAYTRDIMGRLTIYQPPSPWSATNISYDFGTDITQTIARGQAETIISYDNMFRPTLVETADLSTGQSSFVKTVYNGAGQTIFTSFPSASSNPVDGTDITYDGLGRVYNSTENVHPYAKTKTRHYSSHRTTVTDPADNFTHYYYDGYGGPNSKTLVRLYQASGGEYTSTKMYSNEWGEVTRLRQWGNMGGIYKNFDRRYFYNDQRELCRYQEPEGGDTVYLYNAVGQISTYEKGRNTGWSCSAPTSANKVDVAYDLLGRVQSVNFAGSTPDIFKTYDDNSNVLTTNRGTGAGAVNWAYAYDNAGHLTNEVLTLDGRSFPMSYAFNANEHMTTRTLPSGRSLNIVTDGLGRMTSVASTNMTAQTYASGMNYHPGGQIAGAVYGNGQVFSQSLNARQQPLRLLSQFGGAKALDLTYGYDPRGKVTSVINGAITGDNRAYGYDNLGRLTSASGPWGAGAYTYDALGNILTKVEGTRTLAMTYDSKNRMTSHTDTSGTGRSLAYDARGNVTQLGGLFFAYDLSDQPINISGTAVGTYRYDGNKKRVKGTVNGTVIYNIYDASGTLVHVEKQETGQPTASTDYIGKFLRVTDHEAENGDIISTPTYLHMDTLGSAQTGTSANGLVSWREQYMPFGETMTDPLVNADQAGYTGHIKDTATGLNYMQARYYDPVIGRFLSIDPVGFSPQQPFMFGRYTYVGNDPVNLTDPTGMCPMCAPAAMWGYRVYKVGQAARKLKKSMAAAKAIKAVAEVTDIGDSLGDTVSSDNSDGEQSKPREKSKDRRARQRRESKEEKHGDPEWQEPESEDTGKYRAREVEHRGGKKARDQFHNQKQGGDGDRSKQQLLEDMEDVLPKND